VHSQEAVPARGAAAVRLVDAGVGRSGVLGCGGVEYGERESIAVRAGDAAFFVVNGPAGDGVHVDRGCFLLEARDVGFCSGVVVVYSFAHYFELWVEWGSGEFGGYCVCLCVEICELLSSVISGRNDFNGEIMKEKNTVH
jgi:hypothetical protein